MSTFVDTHCHIQSVGDGVGERSTRELWAKAQDLSAAQILQNAQEARVSHMICVGCDLADSKLAVQFAAAHASCKASIGIHPHEATDALKNPQTLVDFAALARADKVIAVGECGLDYFYEHSVKRDQEMVLRSQLDLAVQHNLPVIFHVREAFTDFWPIFDSYPAGSIRGVLHSFTDTEANLEQAVARGLMIGVNGIATFARDPRQQQMYQNIPNDALLLETDAPFLTPVPFRGKINEPKQIPTVAAHLSILRDQSVDEIAHITTKNARALFAL